MITNVPKRFKTVACIDTGLSDFHKMICFYTKIHVQHKKRKTIFYRSYKKFNEKEYVKDLYEAPFHVAEIFDSVDDSYWFCQSMIKDVIDKHAPI